MPYGNTAATVAAQKGGLKPADPAGRESTEALTRSKLFETDLVTKIIPYVDKNYRTISTRSGRAVGGFSRGGGQTLRAAFGNMDKFAWVCCYSAYLSIPEMENSYRHVYENPSKTNTDFKLLWVSVGKEDFLYDQAITFMDFLKSKNVNYKSMITPGGHTWMNVKTYMAETLPLLFK